LEEIYKMLKRILSIALAVVMVMSVAVVAVSAAQVNDSAAGADSSSSASGAGGNLIYFDANGWKNFDKVYCHLWVVGGDSFFGWQVGDEECKKVSGTVWSYDLSKLSSSTEVSGGMQSGKDYAVIFSANTGIQTYDSTIGVECKGDTLYLTGEQIENPVDSKKKGYEAVWENNSSKYGPHKAFTSVGNIVGSKLAPHETGIQVIADWVPAYYNTTYCDPVAALAKGYKAFGVSSSSDLTKVYGIVAGKVKKGDYSLVGESDLKDIKKVMEDAFAKAYPSKKNEKIDEDVAQDIAEDIESGKTSVEDLGSGSGSSGSSYSGSGDSSGSGADGQETTIFFILGGVMIAALGAMFIARKKREE